MIFVKEFETDIHPIAACFDDVPDTSCRITPTPFRVVGNAVRPYARPASERACDWLCVPSEMRTALIFGEPERDTGRDVGPSFGAALSVSVCVSSGRIRYCIHRGSAWI
jgi:hypothetical protein